MHFELNKFRPSLLSCKRHMPWLHTLCRATAALNQMLPLHLRSVYDGSVSLIGIPSTTFELDVAGSSGGAFLVISTAVGWAGAPAAAACKRRRRAR